MINKYAKRKSSDRFRKKEIKSGRRKTEEN
jgi:hypothetical protein